MLWELIGTAQLLSLFSLINLRLMPVSLTDFIRALSPALLSPIPNLLLEIPSSITHTSDPAFKLTDNLNYHPNIFECRLLCSMSPRCFP